MVGYKKKLNQLSQLITIVDETQERIFLSAQLGFFIKLTLKIRKSYLMYMFV